MNILALSTSPRPGGNTDLLTDEFLRGARDSGSKTEKIHTANLSISPCTQCDHCYENDSCCIKDDMAPIYQKLLDTDSLVLASPIYFTAHCAQAKLIIDRCQLFWAKKHVTKVKLIPPGRPTRRGIFISTGGVNNQNIFDGAKTTMRWFFNTLEIEYWGNLLFCGIDGKASIKTHPTALKSAYDLGKNLSFLDV